MAAVSQHALQIEAVLKLGKTNSLRIQMFQDRCEDPGKFGLGCLDFHSSGICGNGVCFCKAPYSGETCESEFKVATVDG